MRPTPSTFLILLTIGACGGGAPTAPDASAEIENTILRTISGRVTVQEEVGLPDVRVDLTQGAHMDSTTTDLDGNYSFEGLTDGTYTVAVSDLPDNVLLPEPSKSIVTSEHEDSVHVDFIGRYVAVEITAASTPRTVYVGFTYGDTLVAVGGDGSYTWSVVAGTLPSGLELDVETGLISGVPAAYGPAAFTVEVKSGDGQADRTERAFDLILHPTAHCRDHPDEAIASFEDPDLEAVVRTELQLEPDERLTCTRLREIGGLFEDAEFSSLQGIQNLTSARLIHLPSSHISDLSPLSELTALMHLSLHHDTIPGDVPLSDISPLAGLTNLTRLTLSGHSIRDISPLRDLTALEDLDLSSNEISDISPLSHLTALHDLSLGSNRISDLTPLGGLRALGRLRLGWNEIHDVAALSGLPVLAHLDLQANRISDVGPLTGLNHLGTLILSSNRITDLSPLPAMPALAHVYLQDNPIEDIDALSGMTGLRMLYLGNLRLTDIGSVASLTHLTHLELDSNPYITDFEPLTHLTELEIFSLRDNPQFTSLEVLSGATKMRWVDVRGDDIESVEVLATFPELELVALSHNPRLRDIQPLIDHPGIGSNAHVWVDGTNVDCEAVEALLAKWVRVRSDCAPWSE